MKAHATAIQRVETLAAAIKSAARYARTVDPSKQGFISYAAFCGGLEAIITEAVREASGEAGAAVITQAFIAAYDDSTPDARAAIAKATGSAA